MSAYYLGVDGGQSSTVALIGNGDGRIVGKGVAGPCNHISGPEKAAKFTRVLSGVLEAAAQSADLISPKFKSACLGLSGGTHDKERLVRQVVPAEIVSVQNDAEVALSGAFAGEPGVIVIAGTGSIAYGRDQSGRIARAGGWGYIYGDEGSAFDITRQALRAALRFEEGWGPATQVRQALLAATGTKDANDLLHRFYTDEFPKPVIAGYARLVDDAARAGDEVARSILIEAANELTKLASAVGGLFGGSGLKVAYIGGVFLSDMARQRFRAVLEQGGATVNPPVYGPATGALIQAYRQAGSHVKVAGLADEKL